jgi:hypothetical protein
LQTAMANPHSVHNQTEHTAAPSGDIQDETGIPPNVRMVKACELVAPPLVPSTGVNRRELVSARKGRSHGVAPPSGRPAAHKAASSRAALSGCDSRRKGSRVAGGPPKGRSRPMVPIRRSAQYRVGFLCQSEGIWLCCFTSKALQKELRSAGFKAEPGVPALSIGCQEMNFISTGGMRGVTSD